MDAKLCTVANKMPQLQGLELHAMCFVFKTAVVFLCKERLRQKKKSLIVSFTKKTDKILTTKLTFFCLKGSSSKSSAAEVEIIRYQVLIHGSRDCLPASVSHFLQEKIISRHGKNISCDAGSDSRDGGAGAGIQSQGCGQSLSVGADTSQITNSTKK